MEDIERREDASVDETQNKEIEEVREETETHAEGDARKWEDVYHSIDEIRKEINTAFKLLDDHRRWMERVLDAGDMPPSEEDKEADLDERDAEFYEEKKGM